MNGQNGYDSATSSSLMPPPSEYSVSASGTVTNDIARLYLSLDAMRFPSMERDGEKLWVLNAHSGADTIPHSERDGSVGKFFVVIAVHFWDRTSSQIDMKYIWCPEEREYVVSLFALVVYLKTSAVYLVNKVSQRS